MKSSDQWVLLDVHPDGTVTPHSKFDRERISARSATAKANSRGVKQLRADSDGSRPPIPTRSRPAFRFDVGHHSEMKPATR
jgi:hypothetical protein